MDELQDKIQDKIQYQAYRPVLYVNFIQKLVSNVEEKPP